VCLARTDWILVMIRITLRYDTAALAEACACSCSSGARTAAPRKGRSAARPTLHYESILQFLAMQDS